MNRELSYGLIEAIETYYENRKHSATKKWNKLEDLKRIEAIAFIQTPIIVGFEAIAGTFIFTWEDNIRTIHSESNYRDMKVFD